MGLCLGPWPSQAFVTLLHGSTSLPVPLLFSLTAAFPIYFLRLYPLLICFTHSSRHMRKEGCKRLKWGTIYPLTEIRFQNCILATFFLLESTLLFYRKLWTYFQIIPMPPLPPPFIHLPPKPLGHISPSLPWELTGVLMGKPPKLWPPGFSQLLTPSLQQFVRSII